MIYRRNMGQLSETITVDPIVVNGQVVDQAQPIIGQAPPVATSWWPLIAVVGALGLVWWFANEDDEEGDDDDRPFDA